MLLRGLVLLLTLTPGGCDRVFPYRASADGTPAVDRPAAADLPRPPPRDAAARDPFLPRDGSAADGGWTRAKVACNLLGVWGTAADDFWAVGGGGCIVHQKGTNLDQVSSPTAQDLHGIWGRDANEIYAVGSGGVILRFDGAQWQEEASKPGVTLRGVSGCVSSGLTAVFAAGAGVILRRDTVWQTDHVEPGVDFGGVFARSPTDVFAVGTEGNVLHRGDTGWTSMPSPKPGWALNGVWGSSSLVFAAGVYGLVAVHDGAWSPINHGLTTHDLAGVWGREAGDVIVLGLKGTVLRLKPQGWVLETRGTEDLSAAWGTATGGDLVIVGDQVVLRGHW
jgi:hypothetical protein